MTMFSSFLYNKVFFCNRSEMLYKFYMHRISNMCHKMEARAGEWQYFGMSYAPLPLPVPTRYLCPLPTSLGRMRLYLENAAMKMNRNTHVIWDWWLNLSLGMCSKKGTCSEFVCMCVCVRTKGHSDCCVILSTMWSEPSSEGPSPLAVIELSMIINESVR